MTDVDLVAKRLAFIETRLHELRTLSRPAEIEHDLRELRFAEHTLQIAIQAALDVASHIVSDGQRSTTRPTSRPHCRLTWSASSASRAAGMGFTATIRSVPCRSCASS